MRNALELQVGRVRSFAKSVEFDGKNIITAVVLFFIGRFDLPGNIMPFGIAAFAAAVIAPNCRLRPFCSVVYGIAMASGLLFTERKWQFFVALFSAVFFYGIMLFLTGGGADGAAAIDEEDESLESGGRRFSNVPLPVKSGIALLVSLTSSSVVILAASKLRLSMVLALFMQLVIAFAAFYVFRNVTLVLTDDLNGKVMTNEEMACIAITGAIAVMGLPAILVLGVSLRNIVCIIIIMIFCYRGGLGTGAACGVTVGILLTAVSGEQEIALSGTTVAAYGFCGFLAGLLNQYRKVGVCLGFVLGNLILASVVTADKALIISMYEMIFAILVFAVLPDKLTEFLKLPQFRGVAVPTVKINYAEKLRRTAVGKLNGFSKIMREMSSVCTELADTGKVVDKGDYLNQIVERVSDRVCGACHYKGLCWEKHFYKNYQQIGKITSILEREGHIGHFDIPLSISKDCPRADEIVAEVINGYEIYKVGKLWQRRMEDNKKIVPLQLKSMAEILEGLASEVDISVNFEKNLEKRVARALYENDLKAKNVTVSKNRSGRYDVALDVACCGSAKKCITAYLPVISSVMGRTMVINSSETAAAYDFVVPSEHRSCTNSKGRHWCPMIFSEAEGFTIAVGTAGCPSTGCAYSGDCHSAIKLDHGQFFMAISDGMGAGEKAAPQSRSVIKLLELFMESGLRCDAAISMVNSLLETGCDKVVSATVDLCTIDLYSGKATFLKLGAVSSAIRRRGKIETIVVSSVPIGMVSDLEGAPSCLLVDRFLEAGDDIIMYSDGIIEAFKSRGHGDADFFSFVESLQTSNPKTLADAILNVALSACGGEPRDDMTVMCAHIGRSF